MTTVNANVPNRHDMSYVPGFGGKAAPGFGAAAAAVLTLTFGLSVGLPSPSPLPQQRATPMSAAHCTIEKA
jgi:hypothetical protein